jgi:hypothetical protein
MFMMTAGIEATPSNGEQIKGEMSICRANLRWAEAEILRTANDGDLLAANLLQNTKFNLQYRCDVLKRRYRAHSKRGPFK